jgi:hypothetical protein
MEDVAVDAESDVPAARSALVGGQIQEVERRGGAGEERQRRERECRAQRDAAS